MHPSFQELQSKLLEAANFADAVAMQRYMKNHFSFLGIKSAQRRLIFKTWKQNQPSLSRADYLELIQDCWRQPEREFQYCALDLLPALKKHWLPEDVQWLKQLITEKSWWDTVDSISVHGLGALILRYPEHQEQICEDFFNSGNLWLQRAVIIHQLQYKSNTNTKLLFHYIGLLHAHPDFFIRKAIGWSLRQLYRTYPKLTAEYVSNHPLSNLSKKEALKHHKMPDLN